MSDIRDLWKRQVRAWAVHSENMPALYRTLAYETLKAWLSTYTMLQTDRERNLQWLIKKLGN